MIVIEKLVLHKCMDYASRLNFIAGQVTIDGTLLIVESDVRELDFFERPVPKRNLFSDGTLLLVQGRCLKDGKYVERNARRYNPNGQLIDAFTLGGGIESVQIDDHDTIWVSYLDEGVFGSFGWEEPTV